MNEGSCLPSEKHMFSVCLNIPPEQNHKIYSLRTLWLDKTVDFKSACEVLVTISLTFIKFLLGARHHSKRSLCGYS